MKNIELYLYKDDNWILMKESLLPFIVGSSSEHVLRIMIKNISGVYLSDIEIESATALPAGVNLYCLLQNEISEPADISTAMPLEIDFMYPEESKVFYLRAIYDSPHEMSNSSMASLSISYNISKFDIRGLVDYFYFNEPIDSEVTVSHMGNSVTVKKYQLNGNGMLKLNNKITVGL